MLLRLFEHLDLGRDYELSLEDYGPTTVDHLWKHSQVAVENVEKIGELLNRENCGKDYLKLKKF